jgi:hypothetical protein
VGPVRVVNEEDWQLDLARPARLRQVGWAVSGEEVVGNHEACAVAIPENRCEPDQRFDPIDYFRLKVRGARGNATLVGRGEARLLASGTEQDEVKDLKDVVFEVIRRDVDGEEDFVVRLSIQADLSLPDPRARLLAVDFSDRMAEALFTIGMPLNAERAVKLGPIHANARFDGTSIELSGYLESYRKGGRFETFLVSHSGGPFQTAPEDGRPFAIAPGDLVVAGNGAWRVEKR